MFTKVADNILCPFKFNFTNSVIGLFDFLFCSRNRCKVCNSRRLYHNICIIKVFLNSKEHIICRQHLYCVHKRQFLQIGFSADKCYLCPSLHCIICNSVSHLSCGMVGDVSHRVNLLLCCTGGNKHLKSLHILFVSTFLFNILKEDFR